MRFSSPLLRRALTVLFVLLVASCSGGGCSSGCAACGTTPLPGGFPKPETIPNAAAVRVTRPGIDFLQGNLATLATKALGTSAKNGVISFDIPKSSQSGADICSVTTPVPPQCQANIDIGNAKLRIDAITPNRVKIDGLLPVRIIDLPITFLGFGKGHVVAGDTSKAPGGNLCDASLKDSPTFPYKEFPIDIELPLVKETRVPRDGYTKLDVDNAVIDIGITKNDVSICDDTCNGFCQGFYDAVLGFAFNSLVGGIKDQVKSALAGAACTAPAKGVDPPCPNGSQPDNADLSKATKCVYPDDTTKCVPALLGTDGRMDLSKALSSISPGTQGTLDFVLASAGDMDPAPGTTTLPSWTPRKPPVPAQDNNDNGITLDMIGGAIPAAKTKCVTIADNPLPTGIPVPAELRANTLTPWPAGTEGPHLGFALAGRFLSYAATSAYNSGALCLGVSSDAVDQLNSGYLSLIVPSIKNLQFEQTASASAAITTRPGTPPKVVLGGGTDPKADPLLTVHLDRFAIDFYVFSYDRFVRIFTYTADVTIPLNLQTGKDPKTNPNGGILPVLGDLKIANGVVTNADALLYEDSASLAASVTGLFGTVVSQFLGTGFSPIDLSSALASAGLTMDIPAGGIRKLTSGTDDFIGLFANLAAAPGAASEEADTRASIVEKIVDPSAMSLTTADRARFPKLRVAVEGIASKPTEHTWWLDQGTHAPWTTAKELLVDADAMLLQGKHVLHVSARIVGVTASEDETPVELPFVIDTLPPRVSAERDGGDVRLSAWDFVSKQDALLARWREGDAPFGEWRPFAESFAADPSRTVDVEVKDEEGNVASVALPLRGRADSTLAAAGSGCGCRTASRSSDGAPPTFAIGALVALGALLRGRRRLRR